MEQSDYQEFYAVWVSTCELISNKTPTDGAVSFCFTVLSRFSIGEIRKALSGHLNDPQNGRFTPKPADIVRQIEGDSESRSLMAWSKVDDGIRKAGSYQSIVFDEPEIMAAIDNMGGWLRLCEMTDKDEPFRRAEFCKLYKGYLTNPPESYPCKLIGLTEAHNSVEHSDHVKPPLMIGDYNSAIRVLESKKGGNSKIRALSRDVSKMIGKVRQGD